MAIYCYVVPFINVNFDFNVKITEELDGSAGTPGWVHMLPNISEETVRANGFINSKLSTIFRSSNWRYSLK